MMADAVWIEFGPGMGAEQYDAVNSAVNPPGSPPEGLIFHQAGQSPDGTWRIIDVWEARGAFDRFFEGKGAPRLAEEIGAEAMAHAEPPKITSRQGLKYNPGPTPHGNKRQRLSLGMPAPPAAPG